MSTQPAPSAQLTLAEKRLLLALQPGQATPAKAAGLGFATDAEVLVAADMLARKGLAEVAESATQGLAVTATGQAVLRDGFPERRAVAAIVAAGGRLPMADLAAAARLGADEATVAVGWLRRKGWAAMEKGPAGTLLVAAAEPKGDAQADALAKAAAGSLAPADKAAQDLLQRGLVEVRTTKSRSLRLTEAGGRARASLSPSDSLGEEVGQVTPELIARWATMTPEQKRGVHVRRFDFDVPVAVPAPGKAHPLTHILAEIRAIFWSMGFTEIAGDYVESAHWNMDALFIPQDHPARDMQDTFYLAEPARIEVAKAELDRSAAVHESGGGTGSSGWGGRFDRDVSQRALLRTHTTNTTIRHLATLAKGRVAGGASPGASQPAQALVAKAFGLGRVFRKETMDATHLPEFTQIEGIVTEPGATFDTLVGLCKHFFAAMGFPQVRFRPAYFPYTEPSMEIDVHYNGRWMELGGCGIFRPEVTKPLGVEHNVVAWGFGLERLAMMRLGLKDIRDLYISDVQWLREAPLR